MDLTCFIDMLIDIVRCLPPLVQGTISVALVALLALSVKRIFF